MNISPHKEQNKDYILKTNMFWYRKTVLISSNKEDVFKSLTEELSNWWGSMDNIVQKAGDIFTISWGKPWFRFKVIEYNAFNSITWECMSPL